MTEVATEEKINQALELLNKIYHMITLEEKPFPFQSAITLAQSYKDNGSNLEARIEKLVVSQIVSSVITGVATGLPCGLLMLVAIPSDIVATLYINIRMVAAIAHMNGHDIQSDQTRTFVFAVSMGLKASDFLKDLGVVIANKAAKSALKTKVSGKLLTTINRAVGFRFITKFGKTGVINLVKVIPLLGGLIGGTFDGVSCRVIAEIAKKEFAYVENDEDPKIEIIATAELNQELVL